jgi:acetyl esterase/lipase
MAEGATVGDPAVVGGIAYEASGQRLDVYRPAAASEPLPVVLLWHGRGPDERDVLAPLARAVATQGVVVYLPDWRSDVHDGGRAHQKASVAFARRTAADFGGDDERIVLAAWSLGGKAAVGVALVPAALDGWRPRAVAGVAVGYTTAAPTTGRAPMDDVAAIRDSVPAVPVSLVHGTADPVVDVDQSRRLCAALRHRGRPVSLTELDTDHAGVVMTEYDPEQRRCRPATAGHAVRAGARTASLLARVATVGRLSG